MRVTEPVPQLSEVETILRRRSATTATAALSTLVAVGFGCSGSVVTHPDSSSSDVASVTSSGGGGSTVVSTSSAGGMGQGGDGGQGGGCVPDPNPCDAMPGGTCGPWQTSCGEPLYCGDPACGHYMSCGDNLTCECDASATTNSIAVETCQAINPDLAARYCGPVQDDDVPPGCLMTPVLIGMKPVWCCPN